VTDHTPAHGHEWDSGRHITVPNCGGAGVTQYTCVHCGIIRLEADDAKGHRVGPEATCSEPQVCLDCGAILRLPIEHEESGWIIDREPTHDREGSRHTECLNCGEIIRTEEIPKLDSDASERHAAYIRGYPDGRVRPEGNMTRAEAAAVFARLLADSRGEDIGRPVFNTFPDIPASAWYAGYVAYLSGYNIIYGYSNGNFGGNEPITRAEFVTMAVRFYEALHGERVTGSQNGTSFTDVYESYWAVAYIRAAADNEWVIGYGDGSFGGERGITRAEVVTIVNRLLGRCADRAYVDANRNRLCRFSDMENQRHWAFYDIAEATNTHIPESCGNEAEVWCEIQ